jgi:hypothetical protein
MKTSDQIERRARELMLATRVQQDLDDNENVMYVFVDEHGVASATFMSFIEAYRYRLMYISSKLEG